jgi:hypothetical protein
MSAGCGSTAFRGRGWADSPRVGRSWAYLRWQPDFLFNHVVDRLLDAGLEAVYGLRTATAVRPHRHGRAFDVSWV